MNALDAARARDLEARARLSVAPPEVPTPGSLSHLRPPPRRAAVVAGAHAGRSVRHAGTHVPLIAPDPLAVIAEKLPPRPKVYVSPIGVLRFGQWLEQNGAKVPESPPIVVKVMPDLVTDLVAAAVDAIELRLARALANATAAEGFDLADHMRRIASQVRRVAA